MRSIYDIRADFPLLSTKVNGNPLIYLDNAATTQLPQCVIDCLVAHYCHENANVHRGIHYLSERSSQRYETARQTVAKFIGAKSASEVVFTSGCTEAVNMVAAGLAEQIQPGDEIIVSELEHHSVFVTMQQLCLRKHAVFRVLPTENSEVCLERLEAMLNPRTRLVCATQVSNLTGTVLSVQEIAKLVHRHGALFLVDGAQAMRHEPVDVSQIDCDYYCFSGHKLLAPAGIGVLYGKRKLLELLQPLKYGGGIVDHVTSEKTTFAPVPHKLEPGTPNYPSAIALACAIDYICAEGRAELAARENHLIAYTETALTEISGVRILGHPKCRHGAVSFVCDGLDSFDIAKILDRYGIAVRSGTHCAQPALVSLDVPGAVRVSPAFYNTEQEIRNFTEKLECSIKMLRKWGCL